MSMLKSVLVTLMVEKIVENRLMWFGHIGRRFENRVVRRVNQIESSQTTNGEKNLKKNLK